jgi:hypothetical protein
MVDLRGIWTPNVEGHNDYWFVDGETIKLFMVQFL